MIIVMIGVFKITEWGDLKHMGNIWQISLLLITLLLFSLELLENLH